jgi:hypothetical protein
VDLNKVGQVKYTSRASQDLLGDGERTISLGPPPSKARGTFTLLPPPAKTKGTINTKQDKDKEPLSIQLISKQGPQENTSSQPLLTLYPTSKSVSVEWRDALRYLKGIIPGPETQQFKQQLADIGVRIKLLDIVAGGVEIPDTKPPIDGVSSTPGTAGKVAITGEFWYDSMVD